MGCADGSVAELALSNCTVFCGSVDEYAASGEVFDCACGLHLCGLLSIRAVELFNMLDTNSDGYVSRSEWNEGFSRIAPTVVSIVHRR